MTASDLIHGLKSDLAILAPSANLTWRNKSPIDGTVLAANPSLTSAIINLIQNSLRSAKTGVVLTYGLTSTQFEFVIEDDGAGISDDLIAELGQQVIVEKNSGLGIGFLLANATIERFAGTLSVFNIPAGGARIEIHIPIQLS